MMPRRDGTETSLECLGFIDGILPPVPYVKGGTWPRPKSARCELRAGRELIIVEEPDFDDLESTVPVGRDILLRFCELEREGVSGDRIAKFAAKYGRLGDPDHAISQGGTSWWESEIQESDVWRWWAGRAAAGLDLVVALRTEQPASHDTWLKFVDSAGPSHAEPALSSSEVAEIARILSGESVKASRHRFAMYLGAEWLSRVVPRLWWDDEAIFELYSGSVIGAVGMQLAIAATGGKRWTRCAGCNQPITPARVYRNAGRNNYCRTCRDTGAPQRDAARRYREKRSRES